MQKRILSVILALLLCLPLLVVPAQAGPYNQLKSTTPVELEAKFLANEPFIAIYALANGSQMQKNALNEWLSATPALKGYSLDYEAYPSWGPSWIWDKIGLPSATLPFICVAKDQNTYRVFTAPIDMRAVRDTVNSYFSLSFEEAGDFYTLNSTIYNRYTTADDYAATFLTAPAKIAPALMEQARAITAGLTDDYAKLQAIHDWVAHNIAYDYDYAATGKVYYLPADVLTHRRTVCEGYARLVDVLCDAVGIPCRIIYGYAAGASASSSLSNIWAAYSQYLKDKNLAVLQSKVKADHAWNEAYIDGRWVILDTTWNSSNSYSAATGFVWAPFTTAHFDPQLADFSADHLFWTHFVDPNRVPSSWAVTRVEAAIGLDLVPAELQIRYTQAITRAEFCALAVLLTERYTGQEITARKAFVDTQDVNAEKLAGLGVILGVGNDKFAPHNTLTREQAAVILCRLMTALGHPLEAAENTFADKSQMHAWSLDEIGRVQKAEIMIGKDGNRFGPRDRFSREESILTIMNTLSMLP